MELVREQTGHVQRIQKTLTEANIRLDSVMSDIMGFSGRRMIEAMIASRTAYNVTMSLDEGREGLGRQRCFACLARFVDGGVGVQHVAHLFGPGLPVDLDESLEFTQDMRVAKGVIDRNYPPPCAQTRSLNPCGYGSN